MPNTPTTTIRIALADDHSLFRAGLRQLLIAEPAFEVVGEAGSGPEILSMVDTQRPDVLLLDLKMPGIDGLEVLRQLQSSAQASGHSTRILILTASQDEQTLAQAIRLGASGIVLKNTATEMLIQAVHKVSEGENWLDAQVTASVIRQLSDSPSAGGRPRDIEGLTAREREIAALVGQGYKYREIAEMLSISEQTVKNHLRNMFHKLGVSDRLQLALYAIHHNL